ncbi:hypothetical protein [Nostoc sp. UHCC 0252]|uniref:hypothetical protein n=1 Tax=Nostoc sp. UHCC 0252 TaxID=3110241 RepID=UPI002B2085D8|nr:hypothetical protein [Nostoc sp. UHCC 0252]MEA5601225.1 hypothetical protein [Nostoc sp. UHCC 0252]
MEKYGPRKSDELRTNKNLPSAEFKRLYSDAYCHTWANGRNTQSGAIALISGIGILAKV